MTRLRQRQHHTTGAAAALTARRVWQVALCLARAAVVDSRSAEAKPLLTDVLAADHEDVRALEMLGHVHFQVRESTPRGGRTRPSPREFTRPRRREARRGGAAENRSPRLRSQREEPVG